MVQIREMRAADAAEVFNLYADSWRSNYGKLYDANSLDGEIAKRFSEDKQRAEAEDPDIITLVAEDASQVVGAVLSSMDDRNQAWIERMHVVPAFKGTGLADDLMRAILVKHAGLQSIALKVLKGNDRAIRFYEKHGFFVTEEIASDATVGGASSIVMSRTIPRS